MKLWILKPAKCEEGDNPWKPWYDKAFEFVIRAEDEGAARRLAHSKAGDENRGVFLNRQISNTNSPWLEEKYSSCRELSVEGEAGIIFRNFMSG